MAVPVNMAPKFSPTTQMAVAAAAAMITATRAYGAGRKMPTATRSNTSARNAEVCSPGEAMPAVWRVRNAMLAHSVSHSRRAGRRPSGLPATNEADASRPPGHSRTASSA